MKRPADYVIVAAVKKQLPHLLELSSLLEDAGDGFVSGIGACLGTRLNALYRLLYPPQPSPRLIAQRRRIARLRRQTAAKKARA